LFQCGPARHGLGEQDVGNPFIKVIITFMLDDKSFNTYFLRFVSIADAARFNRY